jgi:flagellar M-ring protein FliF
LNFSLSEILNSLKNFWNKLTRRQKVLLVLAPLVVATALSSLIFWASRPQYASLFTKLNTNDAGAITAKLKELKINYQLSDGGSTILVPQKDVSEIRLELANAGLPKDSTFSFDNLDQMRIGETDQDRKLRFVLGLQNELEQTIETMNGVEYARVHIVIPEQSLFTNDQKDATAAVTLKTQYGAKIGEDQVRAIANLLAYSVEGLSTDKVTIADTNGNVLSDVLGNSNLPGKMTANQLQVQQTVENNMQQSAQSMLDKVFGAGKTVVRANATLDFDQKKITSQRSEDGAIESRQQTSEKSSNQSANNAGAAGVQSNATPTYPVTGQGNNTSTSEKYSSTENFKPSVTQEETVVSPGQIKRLTVSVLADSDSVTTDQAANIQSIVSSAIGININRGDEIQVALLPFNKTTMLEEQAAMTEAAKKAKILLYAQIAGAAVGGLIFLILFLRFRAKRKRNYGMEALADGQKLVTLEEAEQLFAAQMEAEREAELKLAKKKVKSSEEIEKDKIRKEVDKYVRENPDDVARLVKTWLAEEQ